MQVVPAILPHTFEEVIEKCARVEGVASRIQIDLCDGVIGREKTWLPEGDEMMPKGFTFEFDLMINEWRTYVPRVVSLGATRVILHVDTWTADEVKEMASLLATRAVACGIATSNGELVDFHADMVRVAQQVNPQTFIQVMGIRKIGEQGQFFDEECIARITHLKSMFGDMLLQVDGAMNPTTAPRVLQAGADTLVVGSYIFGGEDAVGALAKLESC